MKLYGDKQIHNRLKGHSYRKPSAMAWRLAQRAGTQAPINAAAKATQTAMPMVSHAEAN